MSIARSRAVSALLLFSALLCPAVARAQGPLCADALGQLEEIARTYEIEIVTEPTFPVQESYAIKGQAADWVDLDTYARIFAAEFTLYPPGLIKKSQLQRVVFCRGLSCSVGRRANGLAQLSRNTIYIDVSRGPQDLPCRRRVIHHEVFHIIDHCIGTISTDERWAALNPLGFRYGQGSQLACRQPETSGWADHFPGFLNRYSTTSVSEDKAEVFAHMVAAPALIESRAKSDPMIRAKVQRMKEVLADFCSEIDEAFWHQVAARQDPHELCRAYWETGDYRAARTAAEEGLANHPHDLRLHELVGDSRRWLDDYEGAIQAYTQAIQNGPQPASVYCNRAKAYAGKRDWERALADLAEAIRRDPADALILVERARVLRRAGERDLARQDLETALAKSPADPRLLEAVGCAYRSAGEHDQAIQCLTEALFLGGPCASLYQDRALANCYRNDWHRVIGDCSAAIQLDPEKPDYYVLRGKAHGWLHQYHEAKADCLRAYELGEQRQAAYDLAWLLATCPEASLRDGAKAVQFAREACQYEDYKDSDGLDVLAAACAEAGRWEEAIDWASRALELDASGETGAMRLRLELYRCREPYRRLLPEWSAAQPPRSAAESLLRGRAKLAADDLDGAMVDLRRACVLNPKLAASHYLLGEVYMARGDAADAAFHYQECWRRDPAHRDAQLGRADASIWLGKYPQALADTESVLAVQPKHPRARRLRALALANLGRLDEAFRTVDSLAQDHPDDLRVRVTRGCCYHAAGRHEEAIAELSAVIRRDPSRVIAYFVRSAVLTALGRSAEAEKDSRECTRLAPHWCPQLPTPTLTKADRKP